MAVDICWSRKIKMVPRTPGISAAGTSHQYVTDNGWINQPLGLHESDGHTTEQFTHSSRFRITLSVLSNTIRYDTIGEFNVDWKAEYSALSSTRSQKKKLKQPKPVPL